MPVLNIFIRDIASDADISGTGGGTRTPTGIRPTDFKSGVSTIPPRPHLTITCLYAKLARHSTLHISPVA